MSLLTIFFLALGLSFDTFAVSVSSGLMKKEIVFAQAVRVALIMALFQAVMPIIGWFGGVSIKSHIEPIDHWVALALLGFIGFKMIAESFKPDCDKTLDPMNLRTNISMALATSIDALAVGVSLALVDVNMPMAIVIIGSVTFLVAMLGILMGKRSGTRLGKPMEVLGGITLIAIGVKIVLEHYH